MNLVNSVMAHRKCDCRNPETEQSDVIICKDITTGKDFLYTVTSCRSCGKTLVVTAKGLSPLPAQEALNMTVNEIKDYLRPYVSEYFLRTGSTGEASEYVMAATFAAVIGLAVAGFFLLLARVVAG